MSELHKFIGIGLIPLAGLALLGLYHLVRKTTYALDREVAVVYLVVQLVVGGFIYWSLRVHSFGEEVSGRVVGGTDRIGTASTTTLLIHLDGGATKEFYFSEILPSSCGRSAKISKPAQSAVWTCSSGETSIVHDANPKGFFLVIAGIGTAFLLFFGRR